MDNTTHFFAQKKFTKQILISKFVIDSINTGYYLCYYFRKCTPLPPITITQIIVVCFSIFNPRYHACIVFLHEQLHLKNQISLCQSTLHESGLKTQIYRCRFYISSLSLEMNVILCYLCCSPLPISFLHWKSWICQTIS